MARPHTLIAFANCFRVALALASTGMLAAAGCSSTPEYACQAPDGITCKSVSEIYDLSAQDENWPFEPQKTTTGSQTQPPVFTGYAGPEGAKPGEPIFREPRRLRVWVVDWEDSAGIYYPSHYMHLRIDEGQWVLPEMRERHVEQSDGLE